MLLMAISAGPVMLTCMPPERPGPNRSTVCVLPREIVVPVLAALVPSPMLVAFGGGFETGDTAVMSTPAVSSPAVTSTGIAAFNVPPPHPPTIPPPDELEPPPQPGRKTRRIGKSTASRLRDITCTSLFAWSDAGVQEQGCNGKP